MNAPDTTELARRIAVAATGTAINWIEKAHPVLIQKIKSELDAFMQYLLTKEEYNKLQNEAARGRELPSDEQLQSLCTNIAETMPVVVKWRGEEPKPWGCILNKPEWYCDSCPALTICPNLAKEYSK